MTTASEGRSQADAEWAVLTVLRAHVFRDRARGMHRPTDPGWHPCCCGWEGYWVDWQPHVAEKAVAALSAGASATR